MRTKSKLAAVVITAGLTSAIVSLGCSDDHDHTSTFPACQAIIDACHTKDDGPGPAHDCHEVAHGAKDEATCTAQKDACVRTCNSAGSDAGTD